MSENKIAAYGSSSASGSVDRSGGLIGSSARISVCAQRRYGSEGEAATTAGIELVLAGARFGVHSGLPVMYQSAQPVDPGSPIRGASKSQYSSRLLICSSNGSWLITDGLWKPALQEKLRKRMYTVDMMAGNTGLLALETMPWIAR